MTIETSEYAQISEKVYADLQENSSLEIGERSFRIIAVLDDTASGYFGAILYDEDSDEIVVAHRGTESFSDYIADAQMVIDDVNQQTQFAYELMDVAMMKAVELEATVSVTGHSLGGALAQLSAAKYQVHGETFNAYGAAAQAESGASAEIINHVRATDVIANAGQHIGSVEYYASDADTEMSFNPETWSSVFQVYSIESTHGLKQFYDGSMDMAASQQRYHENEVWFSFQRAVIHNMAIGVGSVDSYATLISILGPGALGHISAVSLAALTHALNESYVSAQSRVFYGTADVDIRQGSNMLDILKGGLSGDLLSGNDGFDWLHGESGDDELRGGSGVDHVYGGTDNDYLDGGSGSDYLDGGFGHDRYDFLSTDFEVEPGSTDTIVDTDGQGVIEFNGVPIAIGDRLSAITWESLTRQFLITADLSLATQTLFIKHIATGSVLRINDWSNGDLGITLAGTVPERSGVELTGNSDLFGLTETNDGNDHYEGLAGNDGLDGGAGADMLDGGEDADLIFGGSGNDTLLGSGGDDIIIDGSTLNDMRDWTPSESADAEQDILDRGASVVARGRSWYIYTENGAAATGNTTLDGGYIIVTPEEGVALDPETSPSGSDFIDAGDGSDRVFAGEGDDIVLGGLGADALVGGHDHDVLNGGAGNDLIEGDAVDSWYTNSVSEQAEINGHDTVDAGDGDDTVRGHGGNDVIYGGAGNDLLYGRGIDGAVDTADADRDYIDGGVGDDEISGDDGDDTLLGGDGADLIRGDQEDADTVSGNDTIDGGAGMDILAGDGGDDTIQGGAGADIIQGDNLGIEGSRHGRDLLSGGDDNDEILGHGGDDTLLGDAGDDLLIGDTPDPSLAVQYHGNDYIYGGDGNDELQGNGGNDTLDGGSDDDVLYGQDGNDQLFGGDGLDVLNGNAGDDLLDGGDANDILSGDAGNDSLSGGAGLDGIFGGDGNDVLSGGAGDDELHGGSGTDTLYAGSGNDLLWGDAGDDEIVGGAGANKLMGGEDDDTLQGGLGADTLWGEDGSDTLDGGVGNDQLDGGKGDDLYLVEAGWGSDRVLSLGAADAGQDTIRFGEGTDPTELTLAVGSGGDLVLGSVDDANQLTLEGYFNAVDGNHRIEFFDGTVWLSSDVASLVFDGSGGYSGTAGNDTIVGQETDDSMDGGLGNDTIHGGSGNDVIFGGDDNGSTPNNNLLMGGQGADELHADGGDDVLEGGAGHDSLWAGWGDDHLTGGTGDDTLIGDLGANVYYFSPGFGNDTVRLTSFNQALGEAALLHFGNGVSADDVVFSFDGDDLILTAGTDRVAVTGYNKRTSETLAISFEDETSLDAGQTAILSTFMGTAGMDEIAGSKHDDILQGLSGNDALDGNNGNDTLEGGVGDDVLRGGHGDDSLRGQAGNDVLQGGDGSDTYLHASGDGSDTIVEAGSTGDVDILRLGSGVLADAVQLYRDGDDLLVAIGGSEQVRLAGYFTAGPEGRIERIEFDDGLDGAWLSADIAARINEGTANSLTGTAADDLFVVDHSGDVVVEAEDAGTDTIESSVSYALPDNVENITLTGSLNINATGNQLANVLRGNAGNNVLAGELGNNDTAYGGDGDDYYYNIDHVVEGIDGGYDIFSTFSTEHTLADNVERMEVNAYTQGSYNPNRYLGNALDNVLVISALGKTVIDGGAGADHMYWQWNGSVNEAANGFKDSVTFVIDDVGDAFQVLPPETYTSDREIIVQSSLQGTYIWQDIVTEYNSTATGVVEVIGNDEGNRISARDAAAGSTLAGGLGNDTYIVYGGEQAQIVELADSGLDTLEISADDVTAYLPENVENALIQEYMTGAEVHGNAGNNTLTDLGTGNGLYGGAGNDYLESDDGSGLLDGGTGDDTMAGGADNDRYIVDSAGDVILESSGEGWDTVASSVDFALGNSIEVLELLDGAIVGTGNASYNQIVGNNSDNILNGMQGDDTLDGGSGADTYIWNLGDGNDEIEEAENLQGQMDVLELGAGIATADAALQDYGFFYELSVGSAWIRIDKVDNDSVVEQIQFADGTIWTPDAMFNEAPWVGSPLDPQAILKGESFSYTLPASLFVDDHDEALPLVVSNLPSWMSYDAQTGTFSGEVPLSGPESFEIDLSTTDSAGESAGTSLSFVALTPAHGTGGDDSLTGTGTNDALYGLGGNDTLDGASGIDRLYGGEGDDTYFVDEDDVAVELPGEGIDHVHASGDFYSLGENIENLTLLGTGEYADGDGNELDNVITGSDVENYLFGAGGDDTLIGNAGSDALEGGEGNDTMVGGSGDDEYGLDWESGHDTIDNAGGGYDGIYFFDEATEADFGFSRDGDDLLISVDNDSNHSVRVVDHFLGGDQALDYLETDSGEFLDTADINALAGGGLPGTGDDDDYGNIVDGTGSGEQLLGSNARDLMHGLGGDDSMFAFGGDDKLEGGDGNDNVYGGNGTLTGSGNDILIGGDGDDMLVGEDGEDALFGGAGNDAYYYAAGSGSDVIDNRGGGSDYIYFASIDRNRLSFHRDDDDLVVRVDGNPAEEVRVINHFQGGEYAIAFVQPGDGGYGIPASDFDDLLTPMSSPFGMAKMDEDAGLGFGAMAYDEVGAFSPYDRFRNLQGMESIAVRPPMIGERGASSAQGIHPEMRRELDLLINSMSVYDDRAVVSGIPGERDLGISALEWAGRIRPRGHERYATIDP